MLIQGNILLLGEFNCGYSGGYLEKLPDLICVMILPAVGFVCVLIKTESEGGRVFGYERVGQKIWDMVTMI